MLRTNNLVDQEKAVIANQLLANSVIAQTLVDQTRIIQLLVREGCPFVAKPSGRHRRRGAGTPSIGAVSLRSKTRRIVLTLVRLAGQGTPSRLRKQGFRERPQPVHKNEPRRTPCLLRMSYLTLPLCASALSAAAVFSLAAATAEGSAKATTRLASGA